MNMLPMIQRMLLVLLLALSSGGRAEAQVQRVFPSYADNALWHVLRCFWMDCETDEKSFQGAIDLCGQQYSFRTFPSGEVAYFRSDSLRAYFRRTQNCADKEYLLYDFSLEVGDTVYVGFELWSSSQPDTAAFKLASIDTITQFGVSRRRFNMLHGYGSNAFFSPMGWIEGIGSDQDPFYPFLCLHHGCESSYTTLCYDSAGVQLYQEDVYFNTCDTTMVSIDELEGGVDVTVAPNPFTHNVRITSTASILDAEVYSLLGELVGSASAMGTVLNLELPKELGVGMYVVRIRTDRGQFTEKVFKVSAP